MTEDRKMSENVDDKLNQAREGAQMHIHRHDRKKLFYTQLPTFPFILYAV